MKQTQTKQARTKVTDKSRNNRQLSWAKAQEKIKLLIEEAKQKQLLFKAIIIVKKLGRSRRGGSRYDGFSYWDEFTRGALSIEYYGDRVRIYLNSRLVFEAHTEASDIKIIRNLETDLNEQVKAYRPNSNWEQQLDKLATPLINSQRRTLSRERAKERKQLRENFGL